jgi:hypothetical protein
MLKFTSAGLYSVQCVLVGDQPAAKVGIGSTSSASFPPSVTATSGYVYVYNYPLNSSPTTLVTIPLNITDVSKWYYLDAYFSTGATLLYQTAPPSGSAAGSNYGTYVQVGPFGNYLTSATGVASGLLCNCSASSTLSGSYSSNAYRVTLTSSNGWTVSGVSTSLAVTANGNFQVNQAGLYEVNMCLNTVGQTPVQFQVGSLSSDTATPGTSTPAYLYTYAPMYTQDPTTTISMPVNITNVSNVYFVEVSFQGTSTATIPLNTTSTFLSIKPIGSYVTPSTNPWGQQGSSVYYNSGPVGLGMNPSALTETLTVSGNTSFISNVTVTSDVSSNNYVVAKRVPAGSLSVANYVTGSVPLTTTTNLIQNYLSNAAAVVTNAPTYNPALSLPKTATSYSNLTPFHSAHVNTTSSNIFVEAWVYITANTVATQGIFSVSNVASDESGLYINSTGQIVAYETNSTGTAVSAVAATNLINATWTHIAFSFNATGASKVVTVFKNGTAGSSLALSGTTRYNTTHSVYIGGAAFSGWEFGGYIYDMRVLAGSIVPTASFTGTVPASPAVFGLTAPAYVTGMSTGGSANVALSLQSQYFPGASTSPYGPCLTLPGTVGSYYSAANSAYDTNWKTNGFTLEAWVNYASFANAGSGNGSFMLGHMNSGSGGNQDWSFGPRPTGELYFFYYTGSVQYVNTGVNMTTGQWSHVCVQSNGTNIYVFLNGVLLNSGGAAIVGTPVITAGVPLSIGQLSTNQGPNFAIAKARLTFGTSGNPLLGNVYSSGNFTPSPNLGPVPAGATVAWQLETQYPLPTFPSIQDVTELPQQATSYGSLPTPVGGVTSNVLSPYTGTQLNSIRFDGTGYIDYGNAATSVVNSNLWANAWTIEAWVYPTTQFDSPGIFGRGLGTSTDFHIWLSNSTPAFLYFGGSGISSTGGGSVSYNTWSHIAVVYNNSTGQITGYVNGSTAIAAFTPGALPYTPTSVPRIGYYFPNGTSFQGNLADLRVSNVARYTGSTYMVPTQPFASNDANTLLLLKSLGGQTGTTLEVQGRGLNAVSLGATRSVQSYPPAPMSSYLLDTTSNSSVSYGVGKYVASASTDYGTPNCWCAFDKSTSTGWFSTYGAVGYNFVQNGGVYSGTVTTIDALGTSYLGEWLQIQLPVSTLLSNYQLSAGSASYGYTAPVKFWILGSRDGTNWTLVDSRSGITWSSSAYQTFSVSATQSYNYYRIVIYQTNNTSTNYYNSAAIAEWTLNGTEESLCVTADSKVGVGIANPQRALEVAGDLVVSGTISGGAGMGSFRNRIINGDMRIAQRGTSNVVPSTGTEQVVFAVDRWASDDYITSGGGSITQTQQTLAASDTPYQIGFQYSLRHTATVGVTSYVYYGLLQRIEAVNVADLMWGTSFGQPVTVSFWFRTNAPSGSSMNICIRSAAYNVNFNQNFVAIGNGQWQYVTLTIPPPPNGTSWATYTTLYLGGLQPAQFAATPGWSSTGNNWGLNGTYPWAQNAGNFIEFTGIQIERGTVASPFEVRPYATELALCQRYFTQLGGQMVYNYFGSGLASSATSAYILCPLPVPMRYPNGSTVTTVGNFNLIGLISGTYGNAAVGSIAKDQQNINNIELTVACANMTAGSPYMLFVQNSLATLIQINNEL